MDIKEFKVLKRRIILKIIFTILIAIILFVGLTYLFLTKKINDFIFIVLCIVWFFLSIFLGCSLLDNDMTIFEYEYKRTFVYNSLNKIFTNLRYSPSSGLDQSTIEYTRMIDIGDRYHSNDYFEGEYKSVKVKQADVHIEEKYVYVDEDGIPHTEWRTIFRGKWFVFDYNKPFNNRLLVVEKKLIYPIKINSYEIDCYDKVELEDTEFNRMFNVYAEDSHDAFYLLTPSVIEKIKSLAKSINGTLVLCFVNNELHVGLYNNRDSFEHKIYQTLNEEKMRNKVAKDIKVITNFIDELDLDNNYFRKEV